LSYQASTSTPKSTFADPYLLVPNANPVILNADGNAVVYLDGFYRLILTDSNDIMLWEIDNYEWESGTTAPASGLISGMTEAVNITPTAGSAVISVPNLIPLGYRVEGVIVKITTDFGASQGLSSIAIGDSILMDRWGTVALATGQQTGQINFHGADRPIAATAYSVLLSALGGNYDAAGALSIRGFWSSITGWS
jgi:hypothetical protein